MSNIKDGIEDINDKMKTAVKAVANKVFQVLIQEHNTKKKR